LSQVQSTVTKLLTSVSGTDTITAVGAPVVAAYAAGQMFYFVATGDNTGAVTLNIDSLGAKAVTRDGSVALAAGDIKSGEVVVVVYDGTRFQVVSQLNSAGNATFANVSITSALNVGGVATFSAGTAAAPSITTTGDTNTGIFFPAADTIAFTEGGVEAARFDSSGNLGIGTTSNALTNVLTVYRIGSTQAAMAAGNSNTGLNGTLFGVDTAGNGIINQTQVLPLIFSTSNTERMRLDSSGQLGIGTASPGYKLDVRGVTASGNGTITTGFTYDTRGLVGTFSNHALGFITNGASPTMLLDTSGNLGLGVTPRAWAGGYKSFDITGPGAIASTASGDTFTQVANGAWFNGTNWIYQYTGIGAARYQMTGPSGGGNHSWYVAASGTAGNTISFTQAMTLDASARWQLNTTTFVGNEQAIIQFNSSGSVTQALNTRDSNASANNNSHIVLRRSDDTYLGSIGRASTDTAMFVDGNSYLSLRTGATERARITSGGVYLVGTTNTAGSAGVGVKLHPDGLVATVSTTSISDSYNYYSETAGAYRFYVTNGGTVFATNTTISAISDQRLKENIRDLDAGLDAVMALKPRKFDWKAGKGKDKKDDRGFIAQEFEQVFPDLIDTWKDQAPEGEEPYKSVRQDLIPVLVKAIQEQQAIITALTARITALEAK
jgi:hypothetical protein